MARLVPDKLDSHGNWVKSYYQSGQQYVTRSALTWQHIKSRCIADGSYQAKMPSYIGCSMSQNMLEFQFFTNWHRKQVGYGVVGYHMDKDILKEGNKIYHEDYCVLVPYQLNAFLTLRGAARGAYPIGVTYHKIERKFVSQINIGGKLQKLGGFRTADEAHQAYKAAKEAEAQRWYKRLSDGEFVVDARVIERMRSWTLPTNI